MSDEVHTERHGRVLLITMNRPECRNAINRALADQLLAAIETLDNDESVSAGVLAGAGGAFCSGVDLKAMAVEGRPSHIRRFLEPGSAKPLLAAVEGVAVAGGLELALACDLIVAARGARFGIPEVAVGLIAAGGALARLPARLPYGMAMEVALTGALFTAEEAFEHGLVRRLVDPGAAVPTAMGIAGRIAANAPLSVLATKRLIRSAQGCTDSEYWNMQPDIALPVLESQDAKEGARAFAEKRAPVWTGR